MSLTNTRRRISCLSISCAVLGVSIFSVGCATRANNTNEKAQQKGLFKENEDLNELSKMQLVSVRVGQVLFPNKKDKELGIEKGENLYCIYRLPFEENKDGERALNYNRGVPETEYQFSMKEIESFSKDAQKRLKLTAAAEGLAALGLTILSPAVIVGNVVLSGVGSGAVFVSQGYEAMKKFQYKKTLENKSLVIPGTAIGGLLFGGIFTNTIYSAALEFPIESLRQSKLKETDLPDFQAALGQKFSGNVQIQMPLLTRKEYNVLHDGLRDHEVGAKPKKENVFKVKRETGIVEQVAAGVCPGISHDKKNKLVPSGLAGLVQMSLKQQYSEDIAE